MKSVRADLFDRWMTAWRQNKVAPLPEADALAVELTDDLRVDGARLVLDDGTAFARVNEQWIGPTGACSDADVLRAKRDKGGRFPHAATAHYRFSGTRKSIPATSLPLILWLEAITSEPGASQQTLADQSLITELARQEVTELQLASVVVTGEGCPCVRTSKDGWTDAGGQTMKHAEVVRQLGTGDLHVRQV